MSTPDTINIGIKLQAAGENLNTWGDPNLNNDFIVVSSLCSGWNAEAISASVTVSETNYSVTNATGYATKKFTAGGVAAAFNYVLPNRAKLFTAWNTAGYAQTFKLAATTGFALPTGRIAVVGTDGATDVYNMTPNYGGVASPTSGSLDIPAWSAVETAIANAALPATAGTFRVSAGDTLAGYGGTKITVVAAASQATTVTASTTNPGANEVKVWTVSTPELGLVDAGLQTASFAASVGNAYVAPTGGTITLAAPTGSRRHIAIAIYGAGVTTLSGVISAGGAILSSLSVPGDQTIILTDADVTRGYV